MLSDQYGKIDIHSLNPLILTIDDFCDADEVLKIQNFARAQEFMPSQVSTVEGMKTDRTIRSASGSEPTKETERIIGPARERAADLLNFTINASEPTALLKYEVGEEYKNHFDTTADPESETFGRCFTAVLYINDDFEGGETRFSRLGLDIKPKAGRLALWSNKRPNGTDPHPMSLHAGLPVTAGTKWIATFWIHRGVVGRGAAPAAVSAP
ncbi:prolyl hydroxylase family protein [Halocynthiibacter styelae]|uniref:2OG-Fe(II) oxygenase n=1 Tax=Halocynthiibacter styelae TaxID=2761955 RepID=A0A8J7IU60_9RHOB|nr:2OG-Fe(II) oxygenase [Paenihalocynthiibacter styelae]MBI1492408.1 2OG-Fe(II) oxygenase [Paenihalocynthiibacter styelae]